ncbi:hypothetical protein ACFU93_21265 [Streptomyces sp. NPDC057611]|uniref:hypothetical protein n=1 Tax=Streptomyces sp. NPDC057611 TaxID=3346182 RepID=UPI00369C31BB
MTDTAPPVPATLGPRDEARVSYGLCAKKLADLAHGLLAHDIDAPPGDRVRRALALREQVEKVINQAVVAEREEGTSWAAIGRAAGGITRQAAAERWTPAVTAWSANGRRALGGGSGLTAWDAAANLDHAYTRLAPDHPRAFSSTLDAVRFPDQEADRIRREQAAAIEARLSELRAEIAHLDHRFHHSSAPADRGGALRRRGEDRENAARLLDQLAAVEPELADDHHAAAERCRAEAAADREFANLLDPAG